MLVDPTSRQGFIDGLAEAMIELANAPAKRRQLGAAASARVRGGYYDWDSKTDRVLEIFAELLGREPVRRKQPAAHAEPS